MRNDKRNEKREAPRSAGRPRLYNEPMLEARAYLTIPMIDAVQEYGGGVISHGIRRLVEEMMDKQAASTTG